MRTMLVSLIAVAGCSQPLHEVAELPELPITPADRAPEGEILLPRAEDVHYVDVPVSFAGEVHDREAAELTAWWESDRDGLLALGTAPDADGELLGEALLSEGDHTITLWVDDGLTRTGTTVGEVRVGPPNTPPSGEWLSPERQVYAVGETVSFLAHVEDASVPADWLGVEWWSSLDDWFAVGTPDASGRVTLEADGLSVGLHEVRMVVADELGASTTLATQVRIAEPPEVVIVAPNPDSAFPEGRTVVLVAMVQDDDGKVPDVVVGWTSQRDGKLGDTTPDDRGYAEVRAADLTPGEHVLTVTVTDPDGLQAQQQLTIEVGTP